MIFMIRGIYISSFDPDGIGVASLYLNAVQGNIFMQGAKAAGPVTITAGGTLTPTKGIYSGTSKWRNDHRHGRRTGEIVQRGCQPHRSLHVYRNLVRQHPACRSSTTATARFRITHRFPRPRRGAARPARRLDCASRAAA